MRGILLVAVLATTGCGTLFGRGPDVVLVDSEPRGAEVYIDDVRMGVTPFSGAIERKAAPHQLRLVAAGFAPHEQTIERSFNYWCLPNFLGFFSPVGLVAWGVDLGAGNLHVTDSTPIFVTLALAAGD